MVQVHLFSLYLELSSSIGTRFHLSVNNKNSVDLERFILESVIERFDVFVICISTTSPNLPFYDLVKLSVGVIGVSFFVFTKTL